MNRANGPDQGVKFYIVFWVIFLTLPENVLEASFGLRGICSPQLRFSIGPRKKRGTFAVQEKWKSGRVGPGH